MNPNGIQIEGLVFEAGRGSSAASLGSGPGPRALTPELTEDDLVLDRSLRPKMLEDY